MVARHGKLFPALILCSTIINPTYSLYQEYQLAGSIAAAPGYSFGTGQYRAYGREALAKKDFVALEYDLDSIYGDYGYGLTDSFRVGASAKGHVFDYQNLNHLVDSTTGAENKSISLNSPFWRTQGYIEGRYRTWSLRYSAGAQQFLLAARDKTTVPLSVASPSIAFVHSLAMGYWDINQIKPYAFTGTALYLMTEAQNYTSTYTWNLAGVPLTSPRKDVVVSELHLRHGLTAFEGDLKLMGALRGGVTNFALAGEAQDLIQSFSIGGPEARYRRVAGYSFSEFRAPAFGIANLDALMRVAGPVNLWLIADVAVFDRDYNQSRVHGGAGAGIIVDLPDGVIGSRSAAFARAEIPFVAAGGNRFQVFLGINGQIY